MKRRVGAGIVALMFGVALAAAETPRVTVATLDASTQKLTAQTQIVRSSADKVDAKTKEKAAAETRRDALQKKLSATTDPKAKATLGAELQKANADVDSIGVALLGLQKQLAKDARENRRLADDAKTLSLDAKKSSLDKKNAAIEQGMKEAQERYDNAMSAAETSLILGVVLGALQVGVAAPDAGK